MKKNASHPENKNYLIAYLLWGLGFVGIWDIHRLYLGQYGRGMALIVTFGGYGVLHLIDVATINKRIALLEGDRDLDGGKTKATQEKPVQTDNSSQQDEGTQSIEHEEFDNLEAEQAELEQRLKQIKD